MAKVKGKNAYFALDTAAWVSGDPPYTYATLTQEIRSMSNEVTLNIETASIDSSAYGDDFDQIEVLTYKWSVDISAYMQADTTPNTESQFINALLSLAKYKFAISPNGKPGGEASASQPRYSGRVVIASVSVTPARAGLVMLKAKLQGDGKLDRAVA